MPRFQIPRSFALLTVIFVTACAALFSAGTPVDVPSGLEGRWLIKVPSGEDPRLVATAAGAIYVGPLAGVEGYHRIQYAKQLASSPDDVDIAEIARRKLKAQTSVIAFEKEEWVTRYPRVFNPPDPLFPEQWHLENVGQSGGVPYADARIRPAWDEGLSGAGVVIGIVDEGIQFRHPDLLPNWLPGSGYDYNDNDTDPSPEGFDDRHGTAVAGISLAASNTTGVLGIAYKAQLVPLRLIAGPFQLGDEASALSYRKQEVHIYNNSWGPSDEGGVRYADSSQTLKDALENNVQTGRGDLGNIYVWAAGNGGLNRDNSNYDGYNALPYTISVGAIGDDDIKAGYSEPGANLLVVAPSRGRGAGILTTDNTGSSGYAPGDEFESFSGTSAAAPMVSGVVALMLEARPNLNWRDVQQILALTAVPVDFSTDKWEQNGAGYWVSHDYGFGRVDAYAAVQLAREWPSLGTMRSASGSQSRQVTLTDGVPSAGSISINQDFEVQFVRVGVTLFHGDWGDIRIELVSPSGTRSILSEPHANANEPGKPGTWTYLSTRHLGESSQGAWRLEVTDQGSGGSGSWTSWRMEVLGHTFPSAGNQAPLGDDLSVGSSIFPIVLDTLDGITDPDGDSLKLLSVQFPISGTLVPLGEGRFEYEMGLTKDGSESFSVLFGDGNGAVKRRLIRVVDPRPVARNDLFPIGSGSPVDLPVLSNDFDPDGDPLRLISLSGIAPGEAIIREDGFVRYTPPAGFAGVKRFKYILTDDSDGETSGWVTLIVQESPDIALVFDGEDDYMVLPPNPSLNMKDRFTAEAWIYPTSYGEYVTGFGRIFDRDTFVFFLNGFDHSFYNDRSLVAYFITSQGQGIAANSPANGIVLNEWQHVAISYDSSNTTRPVQMYINGQSVAVSYPLDGTSAPQNPISDNGNYPLYIGESDSGARAFKGSMTEFRVWNRVLNSTTISLQHDKRMDGTEAGLQLYLPLDQTFEPVAFSTGGLAATADIIEAQRVPLELPWKEFEEHYSILSDSGTGWWRERTLGWIYADSYPWVYLPFMGWAYTGHSTGTNNYILFPIENNWGWLQTSSVLYPWFYRPSTESWLWYSDGTSAPAFFYDYGVSDWVTFDVDVPAS